MLPLISEWFFNRLDDIIIGILVAAFLGIPTLYICWRQYSHQKRKDALLPSWVKMPSGSDSECRDWLQYKYQAITFRGREEELGKLHQFITGKERFAWWLAVGSGGAGKSRLALELRKRQKINGWLAEFVSLDKTPAAVWDSWQPNEPSLLIFDYVAESFALMEGATDDERKNRNDVAHIVYRLAQRAHGENEQYPLRHPVRVLLLEREYQTRLDSGEKPVAWYARLVDAGSNKVAPSIKECCHDGIPLQVHKLEDDEIRKVAREAMRKEAEGKKELPDNFIEQLYNIDSKGRVLFALMLASYCAKKSDSVTTRDELFAFILESEWRKVLEPAGFHDKNLHFLVMACLCGGRAVSHEENQASQSANKKQPLNGKILQNFGLARRAEGNSLRIKTLEPDILGEYLVLQSGQETPVVPMDKRLDDLVALAWQENPSSTGVFFERARQDFIDDTVLKRIVGVVPETQEGQTRWANCAYLYISDYGQKGDINTAQALYRSLSNLDSTDEVIAPQVWGTIALALRINATPKQQRELLEPLGTKFSEFIENGENSNFLWAWSVLLYSLANFEAHPAQKEKLLSQSIEKHKKSINLDKYHSIKWTGWGCCLSSLANFETVPSKKKKLLLQAAGKHAMAHKLDGGNSVSQGGWSWSLAVLAELATSLEKETRLLAKAEKKRRTATACDAADASAWSGLGRVQLQQALLARRQDQIEKAERLFAEARANIEKAHELKPGTGRYTLACLELTLGNEEVCRARLEEALKYDALSSIERMFTDPLLAPVRERDWFTAIIEEMRKKLE